MIFYKPDRETRQFDPQLRQQHKDGFRKPGVASARISGSPSSRWLVFLCCLDEPIKLIEQGTVFALFIDESMCRSLLPPTPAF
jgi:hypothetical protein